ncbi:MAG: arylsulfotransferase family protein [Candidatus Hodarchaeales archaeon]|jgi:hypothetical protein
MKKMVLIWLLVVLSLCLEGCFSDEKRNTSNEEIKQLEMFRALGYLQWSEKKSDENRVGIIRYNRQLAYDGYNIYCSRNKTEAYLMDMEGNIVHKWGSNTKIWHYVEMLTNGDILIAIENESLLKLKWDGNILFQKDDIKAHHDFALLPDNSFYTLVQDFYQYNNYSVAFDSLIHVTATGEEIDRWSTYKRRREILQRLRKIPILEERNADSILKKIATKDETNRYDYFHMNTIQILPVTSLGEKDKRFQAGNFLMCLRNIDLIIIVDYETKKIVWSYGEDILEKPHHPTMLKNGNILIFDNGIRRKYSRIIEINPINNNIVWEYSSKKDFFSPFMGSAQRLPNGNTLICDGANGRVIEITLKKEIVWEWLNPELDSDQHRGTIYQMMRLTKDEVDNLL